VFKDNLLVLWGLLTTIALVSACGVGEIGGSAGAARGGPEPGASDGDVELSPEAAAEFREDGAPGVTEPSDPGKTNDSVPPACPSATSDVSANDGWRSTQTSQAAFDTLRFEFMARPAVANLNGLVAVGGQDIDEFTDAAISVRFAGSGFIDARDGSSYDGDVFIGYDPGVWYSIVISADIVAQTYDVEVARCGEPRQTLITGAAFRSDASVSDRLTTWAVWSSQSAGLELSTPAWVASGICAPATCQSLGSERGEPSDGCGGSLVCGSCGGDQVCMSGMCVDEPVTVPPPTPAPPPPGDGGRPTAANTGPSGTLSPYAGPSTITQDGAIYENFTSSGIKIDADNVTLRNFRITGTSWYGVDIEAGHSGILIEDGEITGTMSAGVHGVGFTARRLHIHDTDSDAMKPQGRGGPTLIESCFIERLGWDSTKPDGIQIDQPTDGVTFRYNNIWMPIPGSSSWPGSPYASNAAAIHGNTLSNIVYESNWLNGGQFTVYCSVGGISVRNNRFGRDYNYGVQKGSCDQWSGNVWDDTGAPVHGDE
jgi:hypothetical protein